MHSGRCYCGRVKLIFGGEPEVSAYCHCSDCKRWTGAPAPVFVAFADADVAVTPDVDEKSFNAGVFRRNCPDCGSPLTARFDYLPGQSYIPVGLLDDADQYPPTIHCHAASKTGWVKIHGDGLKVMQHSSRSELAKTLKP